MCAHMHRKRRKTRIEKGKNGKNFKSGKENTPTSKALTADTTVTTRSNQRKEVEEKRESKEKRCVHNFVHSTHKISLKVSSQERVTENHSHAHIHPGPHSTHSHANNTHHQEGETSHWAEPQTPALSQGKTCSFSAQRGSRTTYNQKLFLFFLITLAEVLYRAKIFCRATITASL